MGGGVDVQASRAHILREGAVCKIPITVALRVPEHPVFYRLKVLVRGLRCLVHLSVVAIKDT